ncbi:type II secretion system protein F [Pseudomonas sp. DY-1]|jgi:tight adherence protein B|uniref:type II secretion system F family protein n=1 Tax=Pseudomonas sp. DY-1 TaxID=1755504 RepID=UPI000EA88615|nr:type II secretion system F family protein [Pseudomonas sp. DY-1]AYF89887.1 type II secretion system protein F [Pseudomonas sp. DY-1]
MSGPLLLGLLGGLLLVLGLALARRGWRQSGEERVLQRLGQDLAMPAPAVARPGWLERAFLRAGLGLPRERIGLLLSTWLAAQMLAALLAGWVAALAVALLLPLGLRGWLSWRYGRRVRRMVEQLPQMLDQVVRSLHAGRTLGDAVVRAIDASPEPLHGALSRVSRDVKLGVSLPDALKDAGDLFEQEELRILALGVRVNHRYGGSSSELLGNLIKVIHEREQIARQLHAMTGETRFTALVLALLPVSVAGYILSANPGYLMGLWLDASGQRMLLAAFGMQVLGCFILWRMLRSV